MLTPTVPLSPQPWRAAYAAAGIVGDLPPPNHASLAALVHSSCVTYAQQIAYTCVVPNGMNGSLTYAQVDAHSDAFAAYLRQTLKLPPGARVAVQLPNSLGYPVVAFGILKAGCVLVNTNPLYTPSEMLHQFKDAGVEALVLIDMFADKLPAVMRDTGLKHVIVASVTEFFPAVPNAVVRGVQRFWSRVLPPIAVPHVRLAAALAQGREALGAASVKAYWGDLKASDTAALQYTGGTTGVAKGAVLSHGNLVANVQQMLAMGATHMTPGKECVLTALPLYHIFAFTANLLGFLSIGARNILIPSPRPVQNLQRAVENYPVTWITGVNTLFNALLNEEWFLAYPPKHLKASIAGGTALHGAVAERWAAVTGTPIAEGYGLTETSPVVSFNPLGGGARLGSIGIPAPGTEVRLVSDDGADVKAGEAGEIWVRGPQVMQGYWNNPGASADILRDGWLATGDVAVMDEAGFMRIVDRKKDLILVSGFNVYPNEIEDVIARMDAVLEVAVIGIPDGQSGEAVRAYVVPNPEHAAAPTAAQIAEHCRKYLTGYKLPKSVVLRDELPKTPIGKVLRKDLKAEVRAEFAARK